MAPRRKLQVFVSSTYSDLIAERQIAVEAILEAGHIPAGMELFAAGDEAQLRVIRRWIDESDAFLLIVGGRYGSIEPSSGKSYTHLEYDYARANCKPYFAVVLRPDQEEERVRRLGISVIERDHPSEWREFRREVTSSAMVKFWSTALEIKLAIFQSLAELARREDLVGWVPGDQGYNAGKLAEEMARLTRENAELRAALSRAQGSQELYSGLSYYDLKTLLISRVLEPSTWLDGEITTADKTSLAKLGTPHEPRTLLHACWVLRKPLLLGFQRDSNSAMDSVLQNLRELGLVLRHQTTAGVEFWNISEAGRRFILRLELELSGS